MKKLIISASLSLIGSFLFAQDIGSEKMNTQPWKKAFMEKLDVGGYYRFIFNDRKYKNPYDGRGADRLITVIDPTYFDPMLFLYVGGKVTPNSSFGAELQLNSNFVGANKPGSIEFAQSIALWNGLVLRGNTKTKNAGSYDMRFGGIEWMSFTPFTFGSNTQFNRFSIFERRPWDPGANVMARPADYYHTNDISQDVRFGTAAFKGLLVNVTDLPHDITGSLLYGRSQNINGIDRENEVTPKKIYALKAEKKLNDLGIVGLSTYHTVSYEDSISQDYDTRKTFRMAEAYTRLSFHDKLDVFADVGYGSNKEPEVSAQDGLAILMDVKSKKELTGIPLSLRMYKIDKNFINQDSYIDNTTTTDYTKNLFAENPGRNLPSTARMTNSGDLVNNRIGGNLSADVDVKNLKIITGIELSKDQERFAETNQLTYSHRINGLEISRLAQFPNEAGNFGPNQRVNTSFRNAYEIVNLSDTASDGGIREKLTYTSIDVQLKYKANIAGHDLYLFNLNTFSAVNNKAFFNDAFIQASYHEIEAYYSIWRDINASLYYGYESIEGNDKTDQELQDDGELKSRSQVGNSFGVGLDYQINDKTFLYLRQRWFNFNDRNFKDENFDGYRLSIEMKIFF